MHKIKYIRGKCGHFIKCYANPDGVILWHEMCPHCAGNKINKNTAKRKKP